MIYSHPRCSFLTAFFRERSAEDDFQLAVQSLGTGRADADADDDDIDDDLEAELNASDSGLNEAGSDSERQSKAACAAEEEKARTGNGVKRDEDGGSGGTGKSAPPAEHPLQRAVTSFDMALGELNQLVHLVDLARAGEFMVLERVTPSDEEQARATLDQSVSHSAVLSRDTTVHIMGESSLSAIRAVPPHPTPGCRGTRIVAVSPHAVMVGFGSDWNLDSQNCTPFLQVHVCGGSHRLRVTRSPLPEFYASEV